eukprot:COSAG04_NODE_348_length_16121_cov_7.375172_5_plen_343_part_00
MAADNTDDTGRPIFFGSTDSRKSLAVSVPAAGELARTAPHPLRLPPPPPPPPHAPSIADRGGPRGRAMSAKPEHLHGRELWKALIAGSVGNFLEWFDFALYGMFANEIAATFFPEGDAATQLLQSFAVFAGAFVMRPFGGVLFGYIGDKHGRVHSMQLAMSLMAIPTTAIAVLPGYDTLGITSTLLLTVIRLIQGLSVGGAFGGLMTYAMEVTPPQHFGLVSALLKVFPPVPSSFTRFRPYLAHFFPIFPRFLRVFTVSTRRFQRAPSRNPGPRNGAHSKDAAQGLQRGGHPGRLSRGGAHARHLHRQRAAGLRLAAALRAGHRGLGGRDLDAARAPRGGAV